MTNNEYKVAQLADMLEVGALQSLLAELKRYSTSGNDGFGVCRVVKCAVNDNLPDNITSHKLGKSLRELINARTAVHGFNDIPNWEGLAPIERSNIRAKRIKIITDFLEKYLNDRQG